MIVDPPIVQARDADLRGQDLVRYWIVLSYRDARDLLAGVLSPAVRQQLIVHVHPARAESRAEYLLRLEDYAAEQESEALCKSTPPTTPSCSTARTTRKATNPGNGRGSRRPPPANTRSNQRSDT